MTWPPELNIPAACDIRVIGDAVMILGDCLEVLPGLPSGFFDLMWSDPPYGHNNGTGDFLSRRADVMDDGIASAATPIANDSADEMRAVVSGALDEAVRVLKSDCCCCCCCCCGGGGPRPTFAWLAQRMDERGLRFFHSVIWDKANPGIGWRYRRQHEMIMVAHRSSGSLRWVDENVKQPNIIRLSKPRDDAHPNIKPLELVETFVGLHAPPDGAVLDPFMGSGTTGVACMNLGRKFIGIEIEPKYYEIACRRVEDAQRQSRLFA